MFVTYVTLCKFPLVEIGFNPVSYSVEDDDGSVAVTVSVLSGVIPAGSTAVVNFRTRDGTAVGKWDSHNRSPAPIIKYSSTTLACIQLHGTMWGFLVGYILTFDSTTTTISVPISIIDDDDTETEQFFMELTTSSTQQSTITTMITKPDGTVIITTLRKCVRLGM